MSMTVSRRKDSRLKRCVAHRIADIRGGVSVISKELGGAYLEEGTPLSKPDASNTVHVVKYAKVQSDAAAADTSVKVYKGHHFKVNDIVCAAEGAAAVKVTAIDQSNSGYDELTLNAALGALTHDASYLFQAAAEGASGSAQKYPAFCIAGTAKPVEQGTNLNVDAWIIAVTHGNELPSLIASKLRLVENY